MAIYGSDLRDIGCRVTELVNAGFTCTQKDIYRTVSLGSLKKFLDGPGWHKLPAHLTRVEWKEINEAIRDVLFITHPDERTCFFCPSNGFCVLLNALYDVRHLVAVGSVRPREGTPVRDIFFTERCLIYKKNGDVAGRVMGRNDGVWFAEVIEFDGESKPLGQFASHDDAANAVFRRKRRKRSATPQN